MQSQEKKSIRIQRFEKVMEILSNHDIRSMLEVGCGDGKFIPYTNRLSTINRIAVVDVNEKKINRIRRCFPDVESYCASFFENTYEFEGFECIVAIEVIEHFTYEEMIKFVDKIFSKIKPKLAVFTTPNIEYNSNFQDLYNGLRHKTHVFEFSPVQLFEFGKSVISKYNFYDYYTDFCDESGSSQLIVFIRRY